MPDFMTADGTKGESQCFYPFEIIMASGATVGRAAIPTLTNVPLQIRCVIISIAKFMCYHRGDGAHNTSSDMMGLRCGQRFKQDDLVVPFTQFVTNAPDRALWRA